MFLWQNFRQVCIVLEKKLSSDNPVEPSCHSELFVFVAISFSNFWALLYFCIIVFCICLGEPWDNPVEPNCHSSLLAGSRDFSFSTENCKLSNSHQLKVKASIWLVGGWVTVFPRCKATQSNSHWHKHQYDLWEPVFPRCRACRWGQCAGWLLARAQNTWFFENQSLENN